MSAIIPVVLFAYNRPEHLRRTLECLARDRVPLIYAFSDGPQTQANASTVAEVRRQLREVDWCELILCERPVNLGLGRSVRTGVSSVLEKHAALIVFEDDLTCVPGTYPYLRAALDNYADDARVMSVTGWTHPNVIPDGVTNQPYFDGRAECWVWGTWRRAWEGLDKRSAQQLLVECQQRGIDAYRYGADLPEMAEIEDKRNIWAVRWLYWHLVHGSLCMRPPHSLVEHIGFDSLATNSVDGSKWTSPPLQTCPRWPEIWPEPAENPSCPGLWRQAMGRRRSLRSQLWRRLRAVTAMWPGRPR